MRTLLATLLILALPSCSDTPSGPTLSIPEPLTVTGEDVPRSGDGVYFRLHVKPSDDPAPILKEALRAGVTIAAAWQPRSESLCAAPSTTLALVVRVSGGGERLAELGFTGDPSPWIVNCGVNEFHEYDFERRAPEYLFEIGYANFAWGRVITGTYIDGRGRIFRYDHSHANWEPADENRVTGRELREKYANARQVGTVDEKTLSNMAALIDGAAAGPFSDPVGRCADYGAMAFQAYRYHPAKDAYEPVLLYAAGDIARKNLSQNAETLYTWLFAIEGRPEGCIP